MDTLTQEAQSIESQFIQKLKALGETDRGGMAVLRRNAGLSLGESRNALALFYRLLPMKLGQREEIFFLVATLFPLNPKDFTRGDFGASMAVLRRTKDSESLDRRMTILLDAQLEQADHGQIKPGELGFRLRQAVKMLASEDIGVDWFTLLKDLQQWSHPDKFVQRRWARSYFGWQDSEDK